MSEEAPVVVETVLSVSNVDPLPFGCSMAVFVSDLLSRSCASDWDEQERLQFWTCFISGLAGGMLAHLGTVARVREVFAMVASDAVMGEAIAMNNADMH